MTSRSSFSATQIIRSWTVQDVVTILNKNGLGECSDAFQKREIDGDNLLSLTEGKLALWKRDLTLVTIRKLSRFVSDLNASPEKYVHAEIGRHITPAKKPSFEIPYKGSHEIPKVAPSFKPLPTLPVRPQSPLSDTESFDSDFENSHTIPQDELYLNHPAIIENAVKHTQLTKPALPLRPPRLAGNLPPKPVLNGGHVGRIASALHGSGLILPKPPVPHLEHLISSLNLPTVGNDEDYYEEEEYESIDESQISRPQDLGFPVTKLTPLVLPPRVHSRPTSPGVKLVDSQNSRPPLVPPLPGGRARANSPSDTKHTFGGPHNSRPERGASPSGRSRGNSPPYPKHTFSGVNNRPPIPVPATIPSNLGPTFPGDFSNIPAGIPNKMSQFGSRKMNQFQSLSSPSNELKSFPTENSNSLKASNEQLNHHSIFSSSTTELDGYQSEEYEFVDGDAMAGLESADYYLQPLQNQSLPGIPPLPPKPRGLALEYPTPQNRPPSPPRKISTEVVNSDDTMLSDLLRVALATRKISSGSSPEIESREKSPTPELVKSSLFDQKLPERPIQFPTTQRPLPPTPDPSRKPSIEAMNPRRNSRVLTQMPWYHNVGRKRAEEMLKNGEDGRFLLRPSVQTQNQLTLTLWYNKRLYHIGVRQRPDQKFSLGTEKAKELSFTSVEELVQFYQGEELVLFSAGERTGKTLLTTSPPRQSN